MTDLVAGGAGMERVVEKIRAAAARQDSVLLTYPDVLRLLELIAAVKPEPASVSLATSSLASKR